MAEVERTPARARASLIRRYLFVADLVAVATVSAIVLSFVVDAPTGLSAVALYVAACALMLVILEASGLYHRDDAAVDRTTPDDLPSIIGALTYAAFAGAVAGSLILSQGDDALLLAAASWALGVIAVPLARGAARVLARRHEDYIQNTLIVGAGDVGQLVARKVLTHREYGQRLVGFVDARPKPLAPDVADVPLVGVPSDICALARQHDIQRVVYSFSTGADERLLDDVRNLRKIGVQVDIVPRLFDAVGHQASLNAVEGLRVMSLPAAQPSARALGAKRLFDVVAAAVGLVVVAPIFVAISVAIRLEGPGAVFYSGRRVGPGGHRFGQLKFRSMRQHTPAEFEAMLDADPALRREFELTQKLEHDPRVTRVGAFLRRTSLDELPQLINVLRGHLSLVGPRPITDRELTERYTTDPSATGYWDVPGLRPGLTGMWQINGRSTMSFEERIRIDSAYLNGWSFFLDLQILAKTPRVLFTLRGAY